MAASSLRIDVLTGRQVIVAPQRNMRPGAASNDPELSDPEHGNPFIEGNESETPNEILALRSVNSEPNKPGWLIRVVPNRYPAVSVQESSAVPGVDGLLEQVRMSGHHEVVIETPTAHRRLSDLTPSETARILLAWQHRVRDLEQQPTVADVTVFRNEGFSAGASLPHVHSQVLALNTVTPQTAERVNRSRDHYQHTGRHLLPDLIDAEVANGQRIIHADSECVVMCPYAGRVSWQVRIAPRSPDTFSGCSEPVLVAAAAALRAAAAAIDQAVGPLAMNVLLIQPPGTHSDHGWFLDLMPRPARMAGYELATDVDIVTVTPESAAAQLKPHFQATLLPVQEVVPAGYVWREESLAE